MPKFNRMKRGQRGPAQRGSALMLFSVLLPAITLIVGLAVDLTIQYIVQAQLQLATDGAARGAMRLLGTGANATEIATEYMAANMPAGFWFNTAITPTITLSTTSTTETINVSATSTVPLFLGRLLGYGATKVGAFSTETAYNLAPCVLGYPSGTAPAKTSAPSMRALRSLRSGRISFFRMERSAPGTVTSVP